MLCRPCQIISDDICEAAPLAHLAETDVYTRHYHALRVHTTARQRRRVHRPPSLTSSEKTSAAQLERCGRRTRVIDAVNEVVKELEHQRVASLALSRRVAQNSIIG